MDKKLVKYGKSEQGNFEVIDTIGVPHPYCIGPKHVGWAADHFSGMLGEAAIEDGEKHDIICDICRKRRKKFGDRALTYKEHEQALLGACYKAIDDNKPELQAFLLKLKPMCETDKYAGFAFIKKF